MRWSPCRQCWRAARPRRGYAIVADANTWKAAGQRVAALLAADGLAAGRAGRAGRRAPRKSQCGNRARGRDAACRQAGAADRGGRRA